VQRQMCPRSFVVLHVPSQDASQAGGIEDDDVIETLPSNRSDESFDVPVLPRRSRRRQHFGDRHRRRGCTDARERETPIADQVARRVVPWESFAELLRRPGCGRMRRRRDVHHPPAVVGEHDQDEQQAAGGRRHDEEIRGHDLFDVIGQERPPRLRRRTPLANDVFRDAGLTDVDPEFQQFAMDPWSAPECVDLRHRADQGADVWSDVRSAETATALPRPKEAEGSPVPSDDGLGPDDDDG